MQEKRTLILILILGLLSGCQSRIQMSAEQQLLLTLQRGQAELAALFENGQPQSSAWLQQLSDLGGQWTQIQESYNGSDEEVAQAAQTYAAMGEQVTMIAEALKNQNTEKAIEELERLKSDIGKNGEKVNEIVKRWD